MTYICFTGLTDVSCSPFKTFSQHGMCSKLVKFSLIVNFLTTSSLLVESVVFSPKPFYTSGTCYCTFLIN